MKKVKKRINSLNYKLQHSQKGTYSHEQLNVDFHQNESDSETMILII